jgi:putative copper export protein
MGHTVIHPQRFVLAPLLLVHVVVAAVWLGALAGLYIAARDTGTASAPLVARFSSQAGWAVPAIFVCGLVMSALFIRSFAALATPYGAMVLGKALGFAALMALAAQNKWRLGPRLSAGDSSAVQALQRTVKAEWALRRRARRDGHRDVAIRAGASRRLVRAAARGGSGALAVRNERARRC